MLSFFNRKESHASIRDLRVDSPVYYHYLGQPNPSPICPTGKLVLHLGEAETLTEISITVKVLYLVISPQGNGYNTSKGKPLV